MIVKKKVGPSSVFAFLKEDREGQNIFSIGRLLLLLVFCMSAFRWLYYWKDIPPTMSTFLLACLGYVVGSKAVSVVKNLIGPKP